MPISYLELSDCVDRCFPYIKNNLEAIDSPVPFYENSIDGMHALTSTLGFIKQDEYYETFHQKAAYLFCSIAHRHAFENGNKRLAATLLRYFLADNHVKTIQITEAQWKSITIKLFPSYEWKSVDLEDTFYLLLYNLAFIAADGQLRPGISFDKCKNLFAAFFELIFDLPGNELPIPVSN